MSFLKPAGVRMLNFESSSSRLMSMICLICSGTTSPLRGFACSVALPGSVPLLREALRQLNVDLAHEIGGLRKALVKSHERSQPPGWSPVRYRNDRIKIDCEHAPPRFPGYARLHLFQRLRRSCMTERSEHVGRTRRRKERRGFEQHASIRVLHDKLRAGLPAPLPDGLG